MIMGHSYDNNVQWMINVEQQKDTYTPNVVTVDAKYTMLHTSTTAE